MREKIARIILAGDYSDSILDLFFDEPGPILKRALAKADSILSLLPQWKGIESGDAAKRLEQAVEDCADDLEVIATANYEGADLIGWLRAFARASAESARRALPSPPGEE